MLIQVTTGSENFPNSSSKSRVLWVPSRDFPGIKEKFLNNQCHDQVACVGPVAREPAAPGYIEEFGSWHTCTYNVLSGMVFKVYGQRKGAHMVAGRHAQATVYLRARDGAALIRVSTILTGDSRAQGRHRVHVEGRFDRLTSVQAAIEGCVVKFAHLTHEDHVSTMFEIVELMPETTSVAVAEQATIHNTRGQRVSVPFRRRARAIDLS